MKLRPTTFLAVFFAAAAFAGFAYDANAFVICGDGICQTSGVPFGEDCEICPEDCGGSCTICGNGFCSAGESCSSCSLDCGTWGFNPRKALLRSKS